MRIAFDVSPLSHPRTGVGNYVLGSLSGLVEAAGEADEIVPFAVSGRWGSPHLRDALAGLPLEPRTVTLPLAHAWRTAWSAVTVMNALTRESTAAIRSRDAAVRSTGDSWPVAMRRAASPRPRSFSSPGSFSGRAPETPA